MGVERVRSPAAVQDVEAAVLRVTARDGNAFGVWGSGDRIGHARLITIRIRRDGGL